MLVLYCILRELYAAHSTMTIVHITGDTTEFGIVEGDTLVESISIPFGLESVVRGMMRDDTETATEMYSQLELYERNELTVEAALPVKSALDSYMTSLSESLSSHTTTKRFPKTAFILAPSPFTTLFTSLLEPFLRDTLGVSGEILRLEDNVLNASTHTVDDNLSISSRFFHKLHGCGEIDAT